MHTKNEAPNKRWPLLGRLAATALVPAALVLAGCGGSPNVSQITDSTSSRLAAAESLTTGTSAVGDEATSAAETASAARAGTTALQTRAASTAATVKGTAAQTASAASAAGNGVALAPGGFGNLDACKLVTKAEATALLGASAQVSVVGDSVSDGSFSQSCMYSVGGGAVGSAMGALGAAETSAEKSGSMIVQIYPAGGASWFKRDQGHDSTVETGIGDQYFLKGVGRAGATQSGGISVLKGDMAVGISVLSDPSKALSAGQYQDMGRKVVSRLPEQASGPAPAPPIVAPGTPAAAPPTPAPTAAIPVAPTPSPATKAVTASVQAALQAAQAGDLAKARAAYAPVAAQWAAIPNDGKLTTPELYTSVASALQQTATVLAAPDTDAAAAASTLSDLADGLDAALASSQAQAVGAALAPDLAAFATAGAGIPTPIAETSDKNAACALITKAEADATLGGSAEVQALPSSASNERSCRFALLSTSGTSTTGLSATATSSMRCTTATDGDSSCVGLAGAVDATKVGLISVEVYLSDGARWYAENEQRLHGYRSGADIGDQFFAFGAQQIWVLKGDKALSITMGPSNDFDGTPIEAMKSLAAKAASRLP